MVSPQVSHLDDDLKYKVKSKIGIIMCVCDNLEKLKIYMIHVLKILNIFHWNKARAKYRSSKKLKTGGGKAVSFTDAETIWVEFELKLKSPSLLCIQGGIESVSFRQCNLFEIFFFNALFFGHYNLVNLKIAPSR